MSTNKKEISPELIREHGDTLEKCYAEKLLNRIPSYARIWATFIGNDGTASYLPMPGADATVGDARKAVWERLYTLFESLALCWSLEERFTARETVTTVEEYIASQNDWTTFHAHLGRIYDMATDVSEQLDGAVKATPLKEYFDRRCIVLHGTKVPMMWIENALVVPPLGDAKGHWHDKMSWEELQADKFEFVSTRIAETLRSLEPLVEAFLAQVFGLLGGRLSFQPITWPVAEIAENNYVRVRNAATEPPQCLLASGVQNISGLATHGRVRLVSDLLSDTSGPLD